MSRLAKQTEAYRWARRIVRACNRMKAGQGVALQWCSQQRHVLHWMARSVRAGLGRERQRAEMKRLALVQASHQLAGRLILEGHALRNEHPQVQAATLASTYRMAQSRIDFIAQTPARHFRHDKPEIDPKRVRAVGYDLARPGAERTVVTERGTK